MNTSEAIEAVRALHLGPDDVVIANRNAMNADDVQYWPKSLGGSGFVFFVDVQPGRTLEETLRSVPRTELIQVLETLLKE